MCNTCHAPGHDARVEKVPFRVQRPFCVTAASTFRNATRAQLVEFESQPATDSTRVRFVLGAEPPLQVPLLWHDNELLDDQ